MYKHTKKGQEIICKIQFPLAISVLNYYNRIQVLQSLTLTRMFASELTIKMVRWLHGEETLFSSLSTQ